MLNSKSLVGIGIGTSLGIIALVLLLPYAMNTTIDEALPANAIIETMEDKTMEVDKSMSIKTYSGKFVGIGDGIHDAQGIVKTIPLDDGNNILRFENFEATNGPDLYVYLSIDNQASDFVNLGRLKANNGNQNYDIPYGTDLSKYDNVLIWCKAFGVLFGSSQIILQQ